MIRVISRGSLLTPRGRVPGWRIGGPYNSVGLVEILNTTRGPTGSPVPGGFIILGHPLSRGHKYGGPKPWVMGEVSTASAAEKMDFGTASVEENL